ncbi:MAG: RuBisCO large subunit C-terminal-like domain-containing protein [Actinomycetales bacterium]
MSSVSDVFTTIEDVRQQDYVLASYYLELDPAIDILDKAVGFAVGQTLGTWVEVPGVTDEMRARHRGKMVKVLALPPVDLSSQEDGPTRSYLIQIALPTINFGAEFPQLLTTLLGNDASTSVQAKLVDLELPDSYLAQFPGPQFGIDGLRELSGVRERPLLLNMIKPCTGLAPSDAAAIFYETALGGVDFIKDDELLGSPSYSPVTERVREFTKAATAAAQVTGTETIYIPNITTRPDHLLDNARAAVDAGARAVMVSFASVGYGMLQALAETVGVPILGHYASAGMFYEGPRSGMSSTVALGLLPRLAGADLVMLNTPYGGYPMAHHQYIVTALSLSAARPHLKPAMPIMGGGVHPGMVGTFVRELGPDIMLAAGGAVQGHPDGASAGVRAMRAAAEAAVAGRDVRDAAAEHPELATALDLWGVHQP